VDLRAAARQRLGTVGDPADQLTFSFDLYEAPRPVPRRFCVVASHPRNKNGGGGLIRCGLLAQPQQKEKPEDSMAQNILSRACLVTAVSLAAFAAQAQSAGVSFFLTSAGPGKGADLGGLEGADKHCQSLAQAAGVGSKTWHAYLSTQAGDGKPAVNAKDRIGKGPWQNVKGVVIAKDVADLHSANNNLTKETDLTEKGEISNGIGDKPNRHDVLTGSQPDGTAFGPETDRTCKNWTSSTQGAAMVGHSDRKGLREDDASHSWNSSHPSRGPDGGCSQADLKSSGGDGLLYCFAVN
jgi:hypothetical protein